MAIQVSHVTGTNQNTFYTMKWAERHYITLPWLQSVLLRMCKQTRSQVCVIGHCEKELRYIAHKNPATLLAPNEQYWKTSDIGNGRIRSKAHWGNCNLQILPLSFQGNSMKCAIGGYTWSYKEVMLWNRVLLIKTRPSNNFSLFVMALHVASHPGLQHQVSFSFFECILCDWHTIHLGNASCIQVNSRTNMHK